MRERQDQQKLSVAALLLFLVTAFAVSPPEAFYRGQNNNRNRASRTVRLDDHDHDHSLDAVSLAFDLSTTEQGDIGPSEPPVRSVHVVPVLVSSGMVADFSPLQSVVAVRDRARDRAPPSLL